MKPGKPALLAAAAMILLISFAACSSKPFLVVHYQLPSPPDAFTSEPLTLVVRDLRDNKAFLSESAQRALPEFDETYSLVVVRADGSGNLLGIFGVEALVAETFEQRLNNLGLQVSPSADQSVYELEIKLNEFKLDLTGRTWVVNMNYKANLSKNGRVLAMETVDGSAQRLRVMGAGDAEKLLSELLTDMVNRVDIKKLLQQAR